MKHIDTWIFDLDNTLYPASCRLFDQMHVRMSDFIVEEFRFTQKEAQNMRRDYFIKYGTTLRGLMLEHGMSPSRFLDYVHEIDYSAVASNAPLQDALANLAGRKLVFTNGTTKHANRVLENLGVSDHFEAIYDIVDSDYIPKPDRTPYEKFLRVHNIAPKTSAFFEDIAQNLSVPREMGMTTVWVSEQDEAACPAHVDHVTRDVAEFLSSISGASFEASLKRSASG
jgi:putative hydrolase of the HAD superfamily